MSVTGGTTCTYCWLTAWDAYPGTVWVRLTECLYSDMAIVVDWGIIPQKIGSHYATLVNYKSYISVSSILKNVDSVLFSLLAITVWSSRGEA